MSTKSYSRYIDQNARRPYNSLFKFASSASGRATSREIAMAMTEVSFTENAIAKVKG